MSIKIIKYFPAYGRFGERVYGIVLPFDYVLVIRW